MSNELEETSEPDIEIIEQEEPEVPLACGNHELHEAAAEHLTEQVNEGGEGFEPGEIDSAQMEEAHRLSEELGDKGLQNWLHREVSEDLQEALDRIES